MSHHKCTSPAWRRYPLLLLAALFAFDLWGQPAYYRSPDPNAAMTIDCKPNPGGDTYDVIAWTQLIGVKEGAPGEVPVLKGMVRTAIYGGDESVTLRCPLIKFDNKQDAMYSRVALNPDLGCFPVSVCEYPITSKYRDIRVVTEDGSVFPVPALTPDVQTMGVIGDTGCRNNDRQDCGSPSEWPFRAVIADLVEKKPDMVLHMGDYRYSKPKCDVFPCRDNWQNWLFEFFLPAKPLLDQAPIAFARGNHESCEGGYYGAGWFYLLHPEKVGPPYLTCNTEDPDRHLYPPAWYFDLGNGQNNHRIFMLDSANASDYPAAAVPKYQVLVEQIRGFAAQDGFAGGTLVTHRPIWGAKGEKKDEKINRTLQAAFDNNLPSKIGLVQSGHIHAHQEVIFKKDTGRPLQIITGNSGVTLKNKIKIKGKVKLSGKKAEVSFKKAHGYDLWQRDTSLPYHWRIFFHYLDFSESGTPSWRTEKFQLDQ